MMGRIPGAKEAIDPVDGSAVGVVPALRLDTVVLHAQRADETGNVQILGPKALDLAMVGAARKVLVTVEETVPAGALAGAGRQIGASTQPGDSDRRYTGGRLADLVPAILCHGLCRARRCVRQARRAPCGSVRRANGQSTRFRATGG